MHIPLWLRVQHLPEECFTGENRWVFDFIKQGVSEEDANFMGMSWENAIAIEPHWTMAHIAVAMGIFPSVGQARKNGWSSPIETGYSERGGIGKRNLCFLFLILLMVGILLIIVMNWRTSDQEPTKS